MTIIITILGWFTLIFFSSIILAIAGKMLFDAATADYKSYQHLRIFRKRLLRKRYEDYAALSDGQMMGILITVIIVNLIMTFIIGCALLDKYR